MSRPRVTGRVLPVNATKSSELLRLRLLITEVWPHTYDPDPVTRSWASDIYRMAVEQYREVSK